VKANYAIWTCTSLEKVTKSDAIKPLEPASISAARNEHEAFQIVLRSGREPLRGVKVTVSDLRLDTNKGGKIAASNVSLYVPAYVFLPSLGKSYPDALPPYQGPFEVGPGRTQPIWVDVYVPKNAKAGTYAGSISISPENGAVTKVSFTVRVYDFDLPDESKLVTAFGTSFEFVDLAHGLKAGSPEAIQMHRKYYEFLLDRGISTYHIPADLLSEDGAKYLTDPRMTSFVIPFVIPYDKDKDEATQKKLLDRVRALGAWDKGYFYFVDEPVNEDTYKALQDGCNYLRKIDAKVNIVSPYFRGPAFVKDKTVYDLLTGYVNIWCFNTGFFDEKAIEARRKAGDKIWNYVCCGPGRPYANFFVDLAPLEHRMLFWQNYLYQVSGLLYWSTTSWSPDSTKDVWTDVATVKSISPDIYGDGSLVYPGAKVGIDGPVSSIRLEVIRDGLEDYKYLWLLEQKAGRDKAVEYARRLAQSWTEYTRDRAAFAKVRDEIAAEIEGRARKK
jgi:hypothetical protein